MTKISNLYRKVSDNSAQWYTHNPPKFKLSSWFLGYHWCLAKLDTTYFKSKDLLSWLLASEDLICHSDSCQLTAGCSTRCSSPCSSQTLFWTGSRGSWRWSSKSVPEDDGLRLCWFSLAFPQLNKGYDCKCVSHSEAQSHTQCRERPQLSRHYQTAVVCGCPAVKEVRWKLHENSVN